ncbi:MAG: tetratricopeptide repeat protein [Nitrospirae bacterium]|nr:tetratricopeptide repeat protein [Nitrospirota bacterium]
MSEVETERDSTTIDISEELAEADFYYRQELYDEAIAIYERLLNTYPDNEEIKERLQRVREKLSATEDVPFTRAPDEETLSTAEEQTLSKEGMSDTIPLEEPTITPEELEEVIIEEPSEETPEPQLDTEVLEIFEEFKKGISAELEEDDFETHYNLGIAYKEMGLIDDAIKEFQIARKVDEKNIPTLSMLGACYMDKKLYSLAIDAFKSALEKMDKEDEAYWGTKYDLARAFEANGDIKNALDIYIEIYGWDSKFRDVDKKVNALKQALSNEGIIEEEKDEKEEEPKPKRNRISYL